MVVGCMFRKSHAEEFIEKVGTIKTYKQFKEQKKYTSKKIKQLEQMKTLHHLQHKSEGGRTCIENGAIINELAHTYLHSLPRNQEEVINDYIREWKKRNYLYCYVKLAELPERPFIINFTDIEINQAKYDRAKEKRKTKELIKEYEENEM